MFNLIYAGVNCLVNQNNPIRVAHIMGKMVTGGVVSVVMIYYKNINRE
jgi:hypothetical protein